MNLAASQETTKARSLVETAVQRYLLAGGRASNPAGIGTPSSIRIPPSKGGACDEERRNPRQAGCGRAQGGRGLEDAGRSRPAQTGPVLQGESQGGLERLRLAAHAGYALRRAVGAAPGFLRHDPRVHQG